MVAFDNRNASTAAAVRELFAATLSGLGVPATARPRPQRISSGISDEPLPDIEANSALWIDAHSGQRHRLAEHLDAARTSADIAGRAVAVTLQWRPSRPAEEAFAVMSVRDLATLIRASGH